MPPSVSHFSVEAVVLPAAPTHRSAYLGPPADMLSMAELIKKVGEVDIFVPSRIRAGGLTEL